MQDQSLGDYRIIKQIGAGALGRVLLAEHRFIKKHYALKVLPQTLAEEEGFIARFEEEVAKLAFLEHPHIVKIHTVSQAEGNYFLVTDCIVDAQGETKNLAQFMAEKSRSLNEEEVLAILRQIAHALDYAHLKGGVVHRAIKLNNILIGKENSVFISDFGLAKIVSPGKVIMQTFTLLAEALSVLPSEGGDRKSSEGEKTVKFSQAFLQNYAFLAPEQKSFEAVGIQADSYAFGVLAYYLISGIFPEGIFPMPSEIAPNFEFEWDEIISKCLNQDPRKRPTQLVPLLEKKKIRILPKIVSEVISPSDLKTHVPSHDHLKTGAIRSVPPHMLDKEETTLKPIIHRAAEKHSESQGIPAALAVAAVTETKELGGGDKAEEIYAGQLNALLNRDPVVTQYQPEKKEIQDTEPLQTEMAIVRGGHCFRGSNSGHRDESPRHRISLESFALDIHPVTNEQFVRFLIYMGGEKDSNYNDLIRLKDSRIFRSAGKLSIEPGYLKHPVVGVTWYGAMGYARWAGKRLPTEAEWEIAAQGGYENNIYPTGDQIEKNQANFFSSDTTPVMSYPPNGYGLYDMAGNVYEWCQDWYGYNYYETSSQEPTNPKGPPQGVYRVLRGGCWKSLTEDLRCAHRHRNNPGTVNSTYGFRCAADVE
jgi:formylglycine-generating enzyme required for sulfatase activity/tRNA A-37 threonylcarbamoyl transferase component Bud32